jgi:sphingolipid 8-(E)-desaturase
MFSVEDSTEQELIRDLQTYPSLDQETQQEIIAKYRQLDQRIRAAGLYQCNYAAYGIECIRYTAFGLLAYLFLRLGWYSLSGIFLGMLWHQLTFTVHDAGHMGITHNFHIDSVIGIIIANFLGGLSCCWWKRNHNVHHIVTNSAEHDPDIQHLPFFAISPRFFESLRSTYYGRIMEYDAFAKFMMKYQHYLYYPILTFGRFNLYRLGWEYIILGQGPRKGAAWWHRYLELAGQIFFWYWYGYLLVYRSIPGAWNRVIFVLLSHAVTMPVHVQITLSHFAMSTADLGVAESFPQRMLRTTMDVDCPTWLDFFHGGLQFQAVHHLYPRLPRHNLRAAQKLVMEFCQEVKIPYAVYGFGEGNGRVIGQLGEVAKQARMMAECQRSMTVKDAWEGH